MNQLLTVEVADFVDAVDAALADLPADVRAELLEDLPAHLGDVVAEGGSPRDQLGEPAAYASELRAAAGYPPASGRPRAVPWRDVVRVADVRIGRVVGYARFTDLLRSLRPAWWVLRGYLVTLLLTGTFGREGRWTLVPQIGVSRPAGVVAGVAVALLVCALSVYLGRRTRGVAATLTSAAVTVGLVYFSLLIFNHALAAPSDVYVDEGGPWSSIVNVYPYGPDGKVLHNVRLLDQDGNAIDVPISDCVDTTNRDATGAQLFPVVCTSAPDAYRPGTPLSPLPSSAPSPLPSATTPSR